MGPFLEWEKGSLLKLSIDLIVTDAGRQYGWGDVKRKFSGFDGMWACVADRLNKFWGEVIMKGCSNSMYATMIESLVEDFNQDALAEFLALFPDKETIGSEPSKLTKKLWDLGNKRGGGDLSDLI